jgi:uncharacterized protein YdaU (DUF1376 family)
MIAEVINLDLRERGAFFTLVDLMYVHGGSVPDNDDFMRRYLGCNSRGWHTLRDRLLDLQKIYREGNDRLRSRLVDKGITEAQRKRQANSMAGMISQAKRQMTSKVVPDFPEVSNFAGQKPLKNMESASTSVEPYHTPESRYKKKEEKNAPPSSSFENDAVVPKEERKGLGEQSEPAHILISDTLARQIQSRSKWHQ